MVIKLRFERGEDRRGSDRRENRFGFRLMYDEGGGSKRGCTRFVSIVFIANTMIPAEDRDSCSPPRINANELWTAAIRRTYVAYPARDRPADTDENRFRNSFSLFVAQRRLTPLVISSILSPPRALMPLLSPSSAP